MNTDAMNDLIQPNKNIKTVIQNHTLAARTCAGCLVGAILLAGLLAAHAQPLQPEVLFNFPRGPANPRGAVIQGSDGNFYGTTGGGGRSNLGTVFKVTTNGMLTILLSFNGTNGSYPYAGLAVGNDGDFYGTTAGGGSSDWGTVFRITTNGTLTTLVSFTGAADGGAPSGRLTLGSDGRFYGTTKVGGTIGFGYGTVFGVTSNGTRTTLASFSETNGKFPYGGLIFGNDGLLYGTTAEGGSDGYGTVFKVTTNGTLTSLFSFKGLYDANGASPTAGLSLGDDGNLYGTTYSGGIGNGTAFRITTNGTLTTLVTFGFLEGAHPNELTLGSDGNFHGTTQLGGSEGNGTMFRMTTNGTLTTLVSFAYNGASGWSPATGLTLGSDGNFYGTASAPGGGTVFQVTPGGALTRLTSLGNIRGQAPNGLTLGSDGHFYGTTSQGGNSDQGTVFQVTTTGTLTTLVSFNGANGANPVAGLTLGSDGNFYGTTYSGGSNGAGTVFEVTTNGGLTSIVSFDIANGRGPQAAVTLGNDGHFYGTTSQGGNSDQGTVFKVTTNGTLTTLVSFEINGNGAYPQAALTLGSDGHFYGTTVVDTGGNGLVFKVTTNGVMTTLVLFTLGNGQFPRAALIRGSDGNFYGTTSQGGSFYAGTAFKMTTNGTLTSLVSFDGANGRNPWAALTLGNDGNFYGTTEQGGSSDSGTVFQMTTNGTLGSLVSFANTNGANPVAGMTLGSDGNFYGTTRSGGNDGLGTVFRLSNVPQFFTQPTNQVVPAGVNVTLNAGVFGALPMSYQWLFNTAELPGETNASLKLTNVSLSMSGNYALRVTNNLDTASSSNAVLTVLPAVATTLPANELTATGAVLNGSVTLGPAETVAWFEWGTDTNYGQFHGVTNLLGGSGTVTFGKALSGLDGELIYHYRVVASNSFGIAYGTDQSLQVGLVPTAVTLSATVLTTTSVALNATVNPGGRSTTAWFKWGTTTDYGNLTPVTSVGSGAASLNFSDVIAGFSFSTLYHCRVVVSNSLGLAIGGDVTFVTPGAPLAVTGPATFITGTNAWINGRVTPNSLPTSAWFEWGTNVSYGSTVQLGDVGNVGSALSVSNFLDGLEAAVTYHFRLAASNSLGMAFGADAQISTSLNAYAESVLADQPLVYYRFDEASGTSALNSGFLGAPANGTYNATVSLGNTSLVPAFGFAAGFNNTNSSVAVPALGTNNQVTIEFWTKPRTFGVTSPGNPFHSGYNSIYTADNYVPGALHTHFIGQFPNQRWQLAINPSHTDFEAGNAGLFPSNSWVHLVATHDSAAHKTIAYVNGRAVLTNNNSTTVPVNLAAAHIGAWIGTANWFDGEIDEFAIYGTALPASRIQAHYQTAIGNPVLLAAQTTNKLAFSWIGPGFRLQRNSNLSTASGWTNVRGASNSPVSVTISNSDNQFFRLRWP